MQPNGLKKLTIAGDPACGYVLVWQDANGTRTCTRHMPVVTERVRATAREEGYAIEEKPVDWRQGVENPYDA